jgi:hypothetical protein
MIDVQVKAAEAKKVADKYRKIADQDTLRNSIYAERDLRCLKKRNMAEEINDSDKIQLAAARKSANNQADAFCADGAATVKDAYTMTTEYNKVVGELNE